jgi:hypothetical protein
MFLATFRHLLADNGGSGYDRTYGNSEAGETLHILCSAWKERVTTARTIHNVV